MLNYAYPYYIRLRALVDIESGRRIANRAVEIAHHTSHITHHTSYIANHTSHITQRSDC